MGLSLGADDFAELLAEVPGIYINVGTRNQDDEKTSFPHYHGQFNIDERSLLTMTEFYINYALEYLK